MIPATNNILELSGKKRFHTEPAESRCKNPAKIPGITSSTKRIRSDAIVNAIQKDKIHTSRFLNVLESKGQAYKVTKKELACMEGRKRI